MDPFIIFALYKATAALDPSNRWAAVYAQIFFVFAITKTVKLWGLFRQHPSDILFLPLSIMFGYFHGLIKLYALFTLNMVCGPTLPTGGPFHSELTILFFVHRHHGAAEPMVMSMTSSVCSVHSGV